MGSIDPEVDAHIIAAASEDEAKKLKEEVSKKDADFEKIAKRVQLILLPKKKAAKFLLIPKQQVYRPM